jgi:PKD repeat protein
LASEPEQAIEVEAQTKAAEKQEGQSPEPIENKKVATLIPHNAATDQTLEPPPLTYFSSSIQSGCVPLRVQFTNQSVNATSFSWDFGTGEKSAEANPAYLFEAPGSYTVSLTTTNHGSAATVSRMVIEVLAPPLADFQIEDGMRGVDNHVVLNLVNYSTDAILYEWCLVDTGHANCSAWSSVDQQPNLELKTITPESRSVRLKVISEQGCMDTIFVPLPLVVESSATRIKFATAFSPNPSGPGDGSFAPGSKRVDLFHPVYIEVPVTFHMRIFNRRGERLFETHELYQGWDGYIHQERAPGGVYVWMVEGMWADGESFSIRGDVTLVWNQYW